MDTPDLNEAQWALLTLSTMTTIGFGERHQDDRRTMEGQGLIQSVGPNTYRATTAGVEAEKHNGALAR